MDYELNEGSYNDAFYKVTGLTMNEFRRRLEIVMPLYLPILYAKLKPAADRTRNFGGGRAFRRKSHFHVLITVIWLRHQFTYKELGALFAREPDVDFVTPNGELVDFSKLDLSMESKGIKAIEREGTSIKRVDATTALKVVHRVEPILKELGFDDMRRSRVEREEAVDARDDPDAPSPAIPEPRSDDPVLVTAHFEHFFPWREEWSPQNTQWLPKP